jgi:2,4-dienoyl-CoA reductase-like NADH-dependent reductase (Old Yellow Enzyme family)/thioredoxin reductase
MAAMGNNLSGAQGVVTPRTMAYYLERARGGVGMIITEAVAVSIAGRHRAGGLVLYDGSHEDGLRQLVETIHNVGSKVAIQLNHGGRLVDPKISEGHVFAPSEIPAVPGKPVPKSLTIGEIQETISEFARAAKRSVELGFDAIEIHGAHTYLIHQFFSPRSNLREDEYGGSLENRMRFPLEVAKAVREAVGSRLPIVFRLSAEEGEKGGYALEEALSLGKQLRDAGMDILHISAGTTERPQSSLYCIQPGAMPEGCLIHFAERFRDEVGPPVIGVGRIISPDIAERLLEENRIDLVAMGRGLLADPEWPNKASNKIHGPIRKCIGCNRCIEAISQQEPITCSVNPLTGNENRLPLRRPSRSKKIAVVGAGPAGLKAACTASFLGHQVLLYEKEAKIGGQLREAAIPPHKGLLKSLIDYYESRLAETDVEVHLEEEFTEGTLAGKEVDVVVVATGSRPIRPSIPGAEQPCVVMARDVLLGLSSVGQTVLVVGGGLVGCETAEFLAEQGRKVRLIEMLDDIALDVEPRARVLLLQRLEELGVDLRAGYKLQSINHDNVEAEVKGRLMKMHVDSVVLAIGYEPDKELEARLQKSGCKVITIGDCRTPGNIKEAVHQGFQAAYEDLENIA